jgi:hypothetical protein
MATVKNNSDTRVTLVLKGSTRDDVKTVTIAPRETKKNIDLLDPASPHIQGLLAARAITITGTNAKAVTEPQAKNTAPAPKE